MYLTIFLRLPDIMLSKETYYHFFYQFNSGLIWEERLAFAYFGGKTLAKEYEGHVHLLLYNHIFNLKSPEFPLVPYIPTEENMREVILFFTVVLSLLLRVLSLKNEEIFFSNSFKRPYVPSLGVWFLYFWLNPPSFKK